LAGGVGGDKKGSAAAGVSPIAIALVSMNSNAAPLIYARASGSGWGAQPFNPARSRRPQA
jgi:hypothetical protein